MVHIRNNGNITRGLSASFDDIGSLVSWFQLAYTAGDAMKGVQVLTFSATA